ncbi:hypothetical protein PWT90_10832 [Aphanocladium album]|nr:hypothetical protein PWT90_10832 [Aphanocladium album]
MIELFLIRFKDKSLKLAGIRGQTVNEVLYARSVAAWSIPAGLIQSLAIYMARDMPDLNFIDVHEHAIEYFMGRFTGEQTESSPPVRAELAPVTTNWLLVKFDQFTPFYRAESPPVLWNTIFQHK